VADILVVEDEEVTRHDLVETLEREEHAVRTAESAEDALGLVNQGLPDLLITAHRLPGMTGSELAAKLTAEHPSIAVIVVTEAHAIDSALTVMRAGADDYLQKPIELARLSLVIDRCLRREALHRELGYYRNRDLKSSDINAIIGNSSSTRRLRSMISRLGSLEKQNGAGPTTLLTGETGTGKALTARAIHNASARRSAPFIQVSCATLPANLLEAELMGYESGSFTDARGAKTGLFEAAEGGTIFFDEIGHMKTFLQSRLLRIVDERIVHRLGSSRDRTMRATIIAATRMDLENMARDGTFLDDLYRRINVFNIALAPLRERADDVVALAEHFLRRHAANYGVEPPKLSDGALAAMRSYRWPGNVRELGRVIARALMLATGPVITEHDLSIHDDRAPVVPVTGATINASLDVDFTLGPVRIEDVEVRMIKKAMEFTGGNQARSARLLGLSRDAFRYRLEKHGLR